MKTKSYITGYRDGLRDGNRSSVGDIRDHGIFSYQGARTATVVISTRRGETHIATVKGSSFPELADRALYDYIEERGDGDAVGQDIVDMRITIS